MKHFTDITPFSPFLELYEVFISWYPHFPDDETEARKLNKFAKVTQLRDCRGTYNETQVSWALKLYGTSENAEDFYGNVRCEC